MVRAILLALAALALPAQPPLRVAFLGTSITCGSGAAKRFLPLVTAGLEKRFRRKMQTYDLCFGGAHSLTTLLLLKHTALPWHPDLVVVETGALDGFAPELSAPAIERIFHELAASQVPAVFLARPAKCSDEATRPVIRRLANAYGYPVADIDTDNLPDNCHPSDAGHAQIAAALLAALRFPDKPKPPSHPANLANARFHSATDARLDGPNTPTPLTFFKDAGAALKAPPGKVEWRFQFQGTLAAVLFRLSHTPKSLAYQVDNQPWKSVPVQPYWFLNYYLETNLKPGPHSLTLRLESGPQPVILDGLETITPSLR